MAAFNRNQWPVWPGIRTYYSDEYALLDNSARVHPYPRALSIRKSDGTGPEKHAVEELGGFSGVKPLPVGLVVLTHYKSGARWRPRRLSEGKGLLGLFDNAVAARKQPDEVLKRLQRLARGVRFLKGVRGEAREVAIPLLQESEKLTGNGWHGLTAQRFWQRKQSIGG